MGYGSPIRPWIQVLSKLTGSFQQADVYSNGRSEEIIGKALREFKIPRSNVVLLSKCYFGVNEDAQTSIREAANDSRYVNRMGLSRKHIFDAVDASVRRLGTYIDVLQIHRLDRDVPRKEIMKALNDVVESGKVRYIGASSVSHLLLLPQVKRKTYQVYGQVQWASGHIVPTASSLTGPRA